MKGKLFLPTLVLFSQSLLAQSFSSFDGTKIAYFDEGEGTPILLIHGFINTSSSWNNTKVKNELLAKGYRVIAPSLRGNGESDKPQDEMAYANNAEVKDLKLLMSHLGFKEYAALGYSRGAIVLAQLLIDDKRITKAIIGGMGKDFTNPQWDRRIMFMHAFLGTEPLNDQTKGAVAYAMSQNANLKALGYSQKYQPAAKVKKLKKVKIPILIIAGDQDKNSGEPAELAALFKDSNLKITPGIHNTTHTTQLFSDEVIRFLDGN